MSMSKRERFLAAVQGKPVDRPPVTAWVHFQSDHLDGARVADLHEQFARAYDWDVLKVMNDYRYPVPAGVETLADAASLARYKRLPMTESCFTRQLDCLTLLRERVGAELPILETLFEPYQQIVRNIGFSEADNLFRHEAEALKALQVVTDTTCDYVAEVRKLGVDGIFLSINGAIPAGQPRGMTDEQHDRYVKPFTRQVMEAAEGMVRVLHVHGNHLVMDRARDYPCEVIHVSDRLSANPSLRELRQWTDKCLMGGLDETKIQERTLPDLRAEIDDALAQAGRDRFILGPGCTIPSFTSERNLAFVRDYCKML